MGHISVKLKDLKSHVSVWERRKKVEIYQELKMVMEEIREMERA